MVEKKNKGENFSDKNVKCQCQEFKCQINKKNRGRSSRERKD